VSASPRAQAALRPGERLPAEPQHRALTAVASPPGHHRQRIRAPARPASIGVTGRPEGGSPNGGMACQPHSSGPARCAGSASTTSPSSNCTSARTTADGSAGPNQTTATRPVRAARPAGLETADPARFPRPCAASSPGLCAR
jgi:hypothetical protein